MRLLSALLLLLLFAVPVAHAQDARIQEIRDRYYGVTENTEAEGFYQFQVVNNPDARDYPAVGIYRQEFTLTYTLHENQLPVPHLVVMKDQTAAFQTRIEVLLDDDGMPMFLYYDYGEGSKRVYYNAEGDCIRYLQDGESTGCERRGEFEEGEADMIRHAQAVAKLLEVISLGGG
ncbi:MAG: hypothetical protein AAGN64_10035 [Bacteroidota bacterium]